MSLGADGVVVIVRSHQRACGCSSRATAARWLGVMVVS
jgi:hypothetical protein